MKMRDEILSRKLNDLEGHKWPLFHLAARCFAMTMWLVPRSRRFGAALFVARSAVPLIRRTAAYRQQRACKIDDDLDIAVYFVLMALTKTGVAFDPLFVIKGYDEFRRAHAAGRGVMVICPHAALTLFLARLFHDDGLEAVIITADSRMLIGGTRKPAQTLQPSPTFLVTMLGLLRGGAIVCAMPDRAEHHKDQTVEFETAAGPIIIAPALMRVAARCGAKVIFSEMHVEGRGIVATFASPAPTCEGSADAITDGFIEFVRTHIESRAKNYERSETILRGLTIENQTNQKY